MTENIRKVIARARKTKAGPDATLIWGMAALLERLLAEKEERNRVQVEYDTDPEVAQQGYRFMHCGRCLKERPEDISPMDWSRQQLAVTEKGHFQLWCNRHDCNIALMELDDEERPMNDGVFTNCCHCGQRMWLPQPLHDVALAMRERATFYCAYGHPQHYKPEAKIREEELIRRERDRLKQAVAQLEDSVRYHVGQKQAVETELKATKKENARIHKRVHAGVCVECNRSFPNLQRHMASKHREKTLQ